MIDQTFPRAALNLETYQALVQTELSPGSRLRYGALLIAAAMAATVTGSLWLTESNLVPRTQFAFLVMTAIGLSWVGFAAWALIRRNVMLAQQRVIAGRMAVVFTGLFVVGSAIAVSVSNRPTAFAAFITAVSMLIIAIAMLLRAQRFLTLLNQRRAELERALEKVED